MLPFLFTTLKRRLGTEDTKWWSVSGVILSHSSCKQVLRWATVRGLRCRILRFKMRHTFSIGDRSGLQAGQSSTRTLFLRSQDFVLSCIVLLKYAWTSLEKMSSWRQHIVLQNLYVLFSIKGIVHFEIKIWYLSAYPKGIQDVGVFFSSVDPIFMFLGQIVLVCQSYNGRYRSLSL